MGVPVFAASFLQFIKDVFIDRKPLLKTLKDTVMFVLSYFVANALHLQEFIPDQEMTFEVDDNLDDVNDIENISLPRLNIDPSTISVSGFSGGCWMASIMHFIYSDIFKGAGLVGGGCHGYWPERLKVPNF